MFSVEFAITGVLQWYGVSCEYTSECSDLPVHYLHPLLTCFTQLSGDVIQTPEMAVMDSSVKVQTLQ